MLVERNKIVQALSDQPELIHAMEDAFVAYSHGKANIPPVGCLEFPERDGVTHIKYGHMADDESFVIKIASGFQKNPELGLPSGSGIVLVLSAVTGNVQAILEDKGYITAARTAAAGAAVAKVLAPKCVRAIGILGTGNQARLQLSYLRNVTECRTVWLWGRSEQRAKQCRGDIEEMGFSVSMAKDPAQVAQHCNLIVTATNARNPFLYAQDIQPGTHITALGTDAPGKNEIHTSVFAKADVIAADSISQCVDHGDSSFAVKEGVVALDRIMELGALIADPSKGRINDTQITIADLTGVAVQDIAAAQLVLRNLEKRA